MTLVVDASVAVLWSIAGDKADRAETLLRLEESIIAPDLVVVEITNVAWKALVFGGAQKEAVDLMVEQSARYFHELVPATELKDRALEIAIALRHPAYDCFYLALAERRGCRLVTADERLQRRCSTSPFAAFVTAL